MSVKVPVGGAADVEQPLLRPGPATIVGGQALIVGGVVGLLLILHVGDGGRPDRSFVVASAVLLVVASVAAGLGAAIHPLRVRRGLVLLALLIDIVAIVTLCADRPDGGFGALLVQPVGALVAVFGRRGAVGGPLVASALLWGASTLHEPSSADAGIVEAATVTLLLVTTAVLAQHWYTREAHHRRAMRAHLDDLAQAKERARRGREVVDGMVDAATFCVATVDADGRVLRANRATDDLLVRLGLGEFERLDLVPMHAEDGRTPLGTADLVRLVLDERREADEVPVRVGRPDGPQAELRVSVRRLTAPAGEEARILLVARDVTEELAALRARDEMLAAVQHELRTPLTSVLGYVDLALEEPDLPDAVRDQLEVVLKNVERIRGLLADFEVAGEADARLETRFSDCDLSEIVADAVAAARPHAASQDLLFESHLQEPLSVIADAHRLRQVVDNLLANAIKYNRPAGTVVVRTEAFKDADDVPRALVMVQDTGRGMTEAEQAGLFSRFYRAASVRGSAVQGSGLGLSITRDIVDLHGGTIDVRSASEVGTTIMVVLPRVPPGAVPAGAEPSSL